MQDYFFPIIVLAGLTASKWEIHLALTALLGGEGVRCGHAFCF